MEEKLLDIQVTPREKEILDYVRDLEYGEVTVFVQNGKPIRLEEIKKSVQLK